MTINWVKLINVNLLSNRKPKQQGETFNLPGWKYSSGCDTKKCVPQKTGMSPRKLLTGTGCPPKVKS